MSKGWWEVEESDQPTVQKIEKKPREETLRTPRGHRVYPNKFSKPAEVVDHNNVELCLDEPPAGKGCKDAHTCCLQRGHTTPHRAMCGNKWPNRTRTE